MRIAGYIVARNPVCLYRTVIHLYIKIFPKMFVLFLCIFILSE